MWQISAVLTLGLILTSGAFKLYFDKAEAEKAALRGELQQAISNQEVLEGEIENQNETIEAQLVREKDNFAKIGQLTEDARAAETEVTTIRASFARHNLGNLSIRKPGLIEKIINKGTAQVNEQLALITDPRQLN